MSNIDYSRMVTTQDAARAATAERIAQIKAACTERITSVLDQNTVANIQGALLIGALDDSEKAVFAAGHTWVRDTIETCRSLIENADADPLDNDLWPSVPPGVSEMAERY